MVTALYSDEQLRAMTFDELIETIKRIQIEQRMHELTGIQNKIAYNRGGQEEGSDVNRSCGFEACERHRKSGVWGHHPDRRRGCSSSTRARTPST